MLQDFIKAYIEALNENDKKAMRRIEKELAMIGMDRMTLQLIVKEEMRKE